MNILTGTNIPVKSVINNTLKLINDNPTIFTRDNNTLVINNKDRYYYINITPIEDYYHILVRTATNSTVNYKCSNTKNIRARLKYILYVAYS